MLDFSDAGGPRCQATDFDASPGPRLDERDADGLRPADWDLGCCERDEDLLSRRCAERDFGRRVCDRDLLLRRLAGRDPERRNGGLALSALLLAAAVPEWGGKM
ncbi:hypothetical protein MTO96_031956 [Rhipicephalus appendiculatus]